MALLVSGVLVNIGSFSIYPYLAVLLRDRMGMEMGRVGVVLGLATLVQFASAPATAALAERVGLQRCLLGATVLYSLGGAAFLTGDSSPVLSVAGLLLISAGGSLYSPAYRGYLMNGVGPERRPALVSAGNAAGNFGIALGPVLGALLIRYPDAMFGLVTVIYVSLAIGHLFLPRERRGEDDRSVEPFRRMFSGLAVLPFATTALSIYLYMQFYQYLSSYSQGRMPTLLFGAAMMGYSLGLVFVQPLLAERVGRMAYRTAMAVGFACLAAGMAAFAGGNGLTVVAGVAIISVGNAVLFLKNDLEALARSRRPATVVFGQQRLAVGVGSFLSGVIGGHVYGTFDHAGILPGFWLAVAAQCVLLPPLLLGTRQWFRSVRGRAGPR
ncbi:MFS transporter [Verrucosispora sioxanthis]|uniref:MFS transporter n=1 Tax=Verrucosispora sioxanthis TaxID=2499994 RepID=UPI001AA05AF1|nr:MFS transporter [Verrucosispora sioxanthis]